MFYEIVAILSMKISKESKLKYFPRNYRFYNDFDDDMALATKDVKTF